MTTADIGVQPATAFEGGNAAVETICADLWPSRELALTPFPPTPTEWASTYEVTDSSGSVHAVVRCINTGLVTRDEVETELTLTYELGRLGIGPAVRFTDLNRAVVVMDFAVGRPARGCSFDSALQVADLLRCLHAVPVHGVAPALHVAKRRRWLDRLDNVLRDQPALTRFREGLDRYHSLRATLRGLDRPTTLCHNDLNPTNVIVGRDRAWLIDFDHLGVGDPLFDVATVIAAMGLPDARDILAHYLGREPTRIEQDLLELHTCLALLRYGLNTLALVHDLPVALVPGWPTCGGEPFVFDRAVGEPLDRSIFRLSVAFLDAGLRRLASPDAGNSLARVLRHHGRSQ